MLVFEYDMKKSGARLRHIRGASDHTFREWPKSSLGKLWQIVRFKPQELLQRLLRRLGALDHRIRQ